jgi:protein O-mannosyl-transferase
MAAPKAQAFSTASVNRRLTFVVCSLLVAAVFVAFGHAVRYPFVNYDDEQYFSQNPHVLAGFTLQSVRWAFETTYASNWHPLTWLSLMLDAQLFGGGATGPHLTNLVLHAASAVLLFLLLKRLTATVWPCAFVAALFAIHPLRVESVVWVAERKDVLSGLFFMLTLLMYARFAGESTAGGRKSRIAYGLALMFFAMGLMSKPMLVTTPFVLFLLDYWPLQRLSIPVSRTGVVRLVMEKVPFLLLVGLSSAMTIRVQQQAMPSTDMLPLSPRLGNAMVSCLTYLGQLIWPRDLAVFYPFRVELPLWQVVGSAAVLLALTTLAVLWLRGRPYLPVGWLWYLGMLVPVIGIVQVGDQAHANRYTYLPQVGLYLALSWLILDFTASWRHRSQVLGIAACVILAALITVSRAQAAHWRTSESLWSHALACAPENAVAHNNLGNALADQGRWAEAADHFERALMLNPRYADLHKNLGTMLLAQRRYADAAEQFQQALQLNPRSAPAHNGLGMALLGQGRAAEAIECSRKALEIMPDHPGAHNNLGNALAALGRHVEALQEYRTALELNSRSPETHKNMAEALSAMGRAGEAIEACERALELKPESPEIHYAFGSILARSGRLTEAISHFEKVAGSHPLFAEACNNLGSIFASQHQPKEAADYFARAIEARPDFAEAHNNLASMLASQGRMLEAMDHYGRALEIMPGYADAHINLGKVLERQGRTAEAIGHFIRAVEARPDPAVGCMAGSALRGLGRYREAIGQYEKALSLDPSHLPAYYQLAWLLATCPDAEIRDGHRAVDLALKAERLTGGTNPEVLDGLAAAYAAAGQFSEALETAGRGIELARKQGNRALLESIGSRLRLYQAGRPYLGWD